MNVKEQILNLVNSKGPILPRDITTELKLNLTLAGAYLSELVSNKKILLSNTKIGSSPVYYADTQKSKLPDILYKHLNEKDQKAFDLIKDAKVLRDKEQEPLIRVALRNIKDFAIPLQVNLKTGRELFWKYYLIDNKEAETIIKSSLEPKVAKELPKPKEIDTSSPEIHKIPETSQKQEPRFKPEQEMKPASKPESEPPTQNELEKEKSKIIEKDKQILLDTKQEDKIEKTEPKKQEHISKVDDEKNKLKEKIKELEKKLLEQISKQENSRQTSRKEPELEQKQLSKSDINTEKDHLFIKIKEYLESKKTEILDYEVIKKDLEIDLLISIPSSIANIEYYCKAKSKKRCNEGDLASAFLKGQLKKLPVLFITTGDLTKKAKLTLDKEFKNLIFKKI